MESETPRDGLALSRRPDASQRPAKALGTTIRLRLTIRLPGLLSTVKPATPVIVGLNSIIVTAPGRRSCGPMFVLQYV
ncbi:hypothetical protein PG996_004718 [Apiospora saccharicola]|uniref:Uncharacterized protein n=1 Tax=Apiospora saccharicola TaxID=335842 RepID=A0ABR1W510_9PEZI